jgi:cytidine deaminase
LLAEEAALLGRPVHRLRLAAPLYQLQSLIYTVAGRPLPDVTVQDGLLLNDLATHLRRINPDALTTGFAARVEQATAEPGAVLLCDDLRAADADAVVALGFSLVHVTAPRELRLARKAGRGDLSPGRDDHPTEAPVRAVSAFTVNNGGGLAELRDRARDVVRQVLS